jgi:hypothetical protein
VMIPVNLQTLNIAPRAGKDPRVSIKYFYQLIFYCFLVRLLKHMKRK